MALYALWIFLTLCPFLAHSESGDDATPDTETSYVFCFSSLSLKEKNLTCHLAEDDIDDFEYATLCDSYDKCQNGTLENISFNFHHLEILPQYFLKTFFKEGVVNEQNFKLTQIVKIPTPMVYNATFNYEEAKIFIQYTHDYVTDPIFEVEIWANGINNKTRLEVDYQPVTISELRNSDIYHVRVRAKPVKYFDGNWTDWSPITSFRVKHSPNDPTSVTYIILSTSIILVIGIGLVFLRWKEEIQAYITPNIPNPKATLAQIHREKEHPPVSFSPEIFSDININRVDYAEEKQPAPEADEGKKNSTGSYQSETELSRSSWSASQHEEEDKDDRRIEAEMSHLKIRLLDQPEEEEAGLATLQRDCRDETYVTMSSLYKTQ